MKFGSPRRAAWTAAILAAFLAWGLPHAAETLKLRAPRGAQTADAGVLATPGVREDGRKGFDYEAFNGRLESLWFQRKAFLLAGRETDAANQSQLIRSLCAEEGVRRLNGLASALVLEAKRFLDEGNYSKALASLDLAEFFQSDGAQIHRARAAVLWKSGAGVPAAATEMVAAARASLLERWRDLSLVHQMLLVLLFSLVAATTVFAALMLVRYHVPLRHDVEERLKGTAGERWARAAGWAVALLPLVLWVGAGWIAVYWLVATFRYMKRGERVAAVALLVWTALSVPAFRAVVALRGMTEDPMVRNTLASAGGAYDPERVVRLRELVEGHPDDPAYRFLLAGLYQNGRYFDEAYQEYLQVLATDPGAWQAHINLGNIYFHQGQHNDAVVHYRKALELRPKSVLAFYNAYVAQSEAFRFKEAQESLDKGNMADPERMAELLYDKGRDGGRPMVVDATIDLRSLWRAALEGRPLRGIAETDGGGTAWGPHLKAFLAPLSLLALLAVVACPFALRLGGGLAPARRCIRCGRAFCAMCKSEREKGREYCSQCLHLFVLGDGLAAETKTMKMYEVERHARFQRIGRRLGSLVLPGAGAVLRGRAFAGWLLLTLWILALTLFDADLVAPIGWLTGLTLRLDLLRPGAVPASFAVDAASLVGLLAAIGVWLVANLTHLRSREA